LKGAAVPDLKGPAVPDLKGPAVPDLKGRGFKPRRQCRKTLRL